MRLVGAEDNFIVKPYMIRALIVGLIAFVGCLIISAVSVWTVNSSIQDMESIFLGNLVLKSLFITLLLGVVLPLISTYMTIKLYLQKL